MPAEVYDSDSEQKWSVVHGLVELYMKESRAHQIRLMKACYALDMHIEFRYYGHA